MAAQWVNMHKITTFTLFELNRKEHLHHCELLFMLLFLAKMAADLLPTVCWIQHNWMKRKIKVLLLTCSKRVKTILVWCLCCCEVPSDCLWTGSFRFPHHTSLLWIWEQNWLPHYLWCHKCLVKLCVHCIILQLSLPRQQLFLKTLCSLAETPGM